VSVNGLFDLFLKYSFHQYPIYCDAVCDFWWKIGGSRTVSSYNVNISSFKVNIKEIAFLAMM
jgi:hypothetical protein